VLTYGGKLLLIPTLVAVGVLGLLLFLSCRALIGACVRRRAEEDPAA
jgi:hypothetical protein